MEIERVAVASLSNRTMGLDMPAKKRLTISLSLFTNLSETFLSDHPSKTLKSPKIFQGEVIGLGIVAAMNTDNDSREAFFSPKSSRAAVLALSPRSQPVQIVSAGKPADKSKAVPNLEKDEMVQSESYTCVISHFGNNIIEKREYFDDSAGNTSYWISSGGFSASPIKNSEAATEFRTADFLSSCHLCKKKLHGLDIFMYRGEKAFCSTECRGKQISSDERKGKRIMKSFNYSASPCSTPVLVPAGLAAA